MEGLSFRPDYGDVSLPLQGRHRNTYSQLQTFSGVIPSCFTSSTSSQYSGSQFTFNMTLKVSIHCPSQHHTLLICDTSTNMGPVDTRREGRCCSGQGPDEHWSIFNRSAHGTGWPLCLPGWFVSSPCVSRGRRKMKDDAWSHASSPLLLRPPCAVIF